MTDDSPVLFVDFNQNFTSLCVGTRSGYSLLSTESDEVSETYCVSGEPMCLVGRLFTSNLVTLVSLNDMRKLLIFHSRRDSLICDYRYTNTILTVKMNRQRLIVCLENEIFIHNIRDMEMLHRIEDTPPNRNGVIAFSTRPDKCLLAYPGSNRVGTVYIFDAILFTNVTSIAAHDGALAALSFNASSTLLATASERGTVVRVFSIPEGEKVMEFRRGLARCASICSLNFSLDNRFLVCASNTETVHIFKLYGPAVNSSPSRYEDGVYSPGSPALTCDTNSTSSADDSVGSATWTGSLVNWVGGALRAGAAYLPNPVGEVFSQDRSFAFAWIPPASSTAAPNSHADVEQGGNHPLGFGFKKTAALLCHGSIYRLLVASVDGFLYTFTFDPVRGGEASLVQTLRLRRVGQATTYRLVDYADVRYLALITPNPTIYPSAIVTRNTDASSSAPRSFAVVAGSSVTPPPSQDLLATEVMLSGTPSTAPRGHCYDMEFPPITSSHPHPCPAPRFPPPTRKKP